MKRIKEIFERVDKNHQDVKCENITIKSPPDPVDEIVRQMKELRPLPTGMTEFEEWSDRIISGTLLPAEPESQKFALASMLMHLSPTTDHETDGYFIKSLRKAAINQIAHAKMAEIRDAAKARLSAEEAKVAEDAAAEVKANENNT